jgi:gamma-glutamylcyclotransferase (GGCT)/AIG2-like uncharacterized protein YtfP
MGDSAGRLFVYGTLIDREFRETMLGRVIDSIEATLEGFERGRGAHWHIARREGVSVRAVVLIGITEAEFAKLDEYEEVPTLYTRERVMVTDKQGRALECWVYLPTGWERQ